MKESTKLIFSALEKIHGYFASLESPNNSKYSFIRVSVYHRQAKDFSLELNFETKEFYLVSARSVSEENEKGERKWYTDCLEYRLKYTEAEKDEFIADGDGLDLYLEMAQHLIENWTFIKKNFISKYETAMHIDEAFTETLSNFEA